MINTNKNSLIFLFIISLMFQSVFPLDSAAETNSPFKGKVALEFISDDQIEARLLNHFEFVDANKIAWPVPKGTILNGASIPKAFWSFIGGPYSGKYLAASVVHDYYCVTRSRTPKATHLVFREAMIASGVSASKAEVMYRAVRWFGPSWTDLKRMPDNCSSIDTLDDSCIRNSESLDAPVAREPTAEEMSAFLKELRDDSFIDEADEIEKLQQLP